MLTATVQHSTELVGFITALNIVLYQPQIGHLLRMVDALITSNDTKTISGLYRLLKGQHRLEHFQTLLRSVLSPFAQPQQIETCLQDVFSPSTWAIP